MNFPISLYLEYNEKGHMFYSTRWASLPGWFLSGDLLITEWPLISGKSVRCISLPLLDCSKNSSCQEIWGLQSQIYRCSELQEQLPHRRYLSQWKQTGLCIQVYANGEVYVILCTEGKTTLLPTTYGMHAPTLHANWSCRPHTNNCKKQTFSFSIVA